MNSNEFRNELGHFLKRAMLHQSIASLYSVDLIKNLLKDLNDPDFAKDATIEQLYDLRGRLFQLEAFCGGVVKSIEDSGLVFLGEFEDKKMDLSEIGIINRNFICTKEFVDPFSHLTILVGTEIEVSELSYPNVSNMITVYYKKLLTSNDQKKLIDVYENGNQPTLLTLKILGDNFRTL